MARRYYSSRNQLKSLTTDGVYWKLQHLYLLFRDRDYFKHKASITQRDVPDWIQHEAGVALDFQPFPITKWTTETITEDHVFDAIEFLYDHVSRPGNWDAIDTGDGYPYYDWTEYDDEAGRAEFREKANAFLCDYESGFELTADGTILALGADGLQHILDAEIIPFDEANVDSKVRDAIKKWRNRHLDSVEKRKAIRELADVFEWLKKTQKLQQVLSRKDESALFEIANNFAIRHHDPNQKSNYDQSIWYSWIFHFYLATYHAVIRSLIKQAKTKKRTTQAK
jgi:hypothetical protein